MASGPIANFHLASETPPVFRRSCQLSGLVWPACTREPGTALARLVVLVLYLSICLSVCLSVCLSTHLSTVYLVVLLLHLPL